jgi:hypothetical protein
VITVPSPLRRHLVTALDHGALDDVGADVVFEVRAELAAELGAGRTLVGGVGGPR